MEISIFDFKFTFVFCKCIIIIKSKNFAGFKVDLIVYENAMWFPIFSGYFAKVAENSRSP